MKHLLLSLLGVFLGGAFVYFYMANDMNKAIEYWEAGNIVTTVEALRDIRSNGKNEGLKVLENQVNASLIIFHGSPPQTKEAMSAIQVAERYRKQFPYKDEDTNIDITVKEVLKANAARQP